MTSSARMLRRFPSINCLFHLSLSAPTDRLNVDSKDRSWANLRPFIWETEIEEKALGQDQKMFFQRIKAN